ncbi:MAG: type III restriction endonuclease subunit R [Pseudanabaena frigida]|uniref:Type III restriction endonuclease subunit R n=1 Tax=Pseudanabaena frigida TaxID=945775 RepID=A0A2W4XRR0_9CYAN|nr:MAG: type III restriction endonuclease subunit R [Pseudanabaena frigida]
MSELRDYQKRVIDEIYTTWRLGKRSILLAMPTGSGKTRTFSELAKHFYDRQQRVLLLVHREELLWQARNTLEKTLRSPIGVIKADRPMHLEYPVQCASVQTLVKRLEKQEVDLGAIALVIVDEAHLSLAPSYLKILSYFPEALILGVTATPSRLDGRGFDRLYEALVIGPSVSELIWRGFLADYDVLAPESFLPTEEGIRIAGGDFNSADLAERIDRRYVAGCAVDAYMRHAHQKRCVVFAINLDHSKAIAERYRTAGIAAEHIDGETVPKERQAILERFRGGQTRVLCNVNLFTEGFDVPEIEVIQLCRPTKSVALHLQMLGRGLRPKGGSKALVLDHAGNCLRLGGAKAERNWTLQGLVEEVPELQPALEAFVEQPIPVIPKFQIDLPNLPKRRVEIYETDADFYNIPTHTELETHLAQQTYRQLSQPRTATSRSLRSPSESEPNQPSRNRRSAQTRKINTNPSQKPSSTNRSSRPSHQLSPLQKVSKAAIELAETLESILVWVWRSWFPPKRKQIDASRRYKHPPNFR